MKKKPKPKTPTRDRGGPPAPWWFIVAEEHHPNRDRPLIVNSLTRKDPVEWLMDYRTQYPHGVNLLAFMRVYRTPTKEEREMFP